MTLFEIAGLTLVLSALFGLINERFIGLPHTIGITVMALVASLLLVAVEHLVPGTAMANTIDQAVNRVDFEDTLMNGLLSFLLFAGAIHVDLELLRQRAGAVALMATAGVLISTVVVGVLSWLAFDWLGAPIPIAWAFVFGALISPTDPVAVLGVIQEAKAPATVEAQDHGRNRCSTTASASSSCCSRCSSPTGPAAVTRTRSCCSRRRRAAASPSASPAAGS